MTGVLKANDCTPGELESLVDAFDRSNDLTHLRCWIEATDGWAFDRWSGLGGMLRWCAAGQPPTGLPGRDAIRRSLSGRLFRPDGELRWRNIPALGDSCCRVVFLGNRDWGGNDLRDCSTELADLEPEQKEHILWGLQTGSTAGEWIELRIPHRFQYPIAGNPRGVTAVVEYWYDALGEAQFIRLCDLRPFEESE